MCIQTGEEFYVAGLAVFLNPHPTWTRARLLRFALLRLTFLLPTGRTAEMRTGSRLWPTVLRRKSMFRP